jgi:cytochrome b pre-mRNA-processing protein 3
MFQRIRPREDPTDNIRRLYGAIVAQARRPQFYADYGVPDTVEGRFDMVVLHVYLVFRRLASAGESARECGQEMFDLFIEDMDATMRELGVGDLTVPRKVRAMAEGYYGRAVAYDAALLDSGDDQLIAALTRNVYAGDENARDGAARLGSYVRCAGKKLTDTKTDQIQSTAFAFPDPGEVRA